MQDQVPFNEEDTWGPLGLVTIHCPSEPLLEFVFIHGLGGGSRKTWSFSSKLHHFWPKEWLSKDPAFQNVRVHSFGYKSTWHDTRGSILNVHDIAESLLGAMHNSPSIRSSPDSKIVLIAHSLGGLVAKKVPSNSINSVVTQANISRHILKPVPIQTISNLVDEYTVYISSQRRIKVPRAPNLLKLSSAFPLFMAKSPLSRISSRRR